MVEMFFFCHQARTTPPHLQRCLTWLASRLEVVAVAASFWSRQLSACFRNWDTCQPPTWRQ